MLTSISHTKFEAETSTRLFFMGLMAVKDRIVIVDKVIKYLEELIAKYEEGEKTFKNRTWTKEQEDYVTYQFKTLSLGIHNHKSNLEWFKALREELEDNKKEEEDHDS